MMFPLLSWHFLLFMVSSEDSLMQRGECSEIYFQGKQNMDDQPKGSCKDAVGLSRICPEGFPAVSGILEPLI